MRVMGVEFAGSNMNYVLIESEGEKIKVTTANRLTLGDTRSASDLRSFQDAVITTLNELRPEMIAIKLKPESGAMRAGAAALKMECLVLANASAPVRFISGAKTKAAPSVRNELFEYQKEALKTAVAATIKG